MLWNTTLPVIKISILLFLRRLFPMRQMLYACYGIGAFLVLWYVAFQTTAIVQCLPIHYFWHREGPGHCINNVTFYIVLASLNLATDVAVLVLPVPFIWRLQMQKRKRIGISSVFLIGLL